MQAAGSPRLSLNLIHDVSQVLEYKFMVNALLAGSVVALMAGTVGWMMVVRRETFAGHTLAMMAFPGAAGAGLLGVPSALGYYVFCSAGALSIGRLGGQRGSSWSERSAATGAVQALALAIGFLFLSLYGGVLADLESLLFGNLLGISDSHLIALAVVAGLALVLMAILWRPLLLASLDADAAQARGVPVRALSVGFLLVLGFAVAATSQITGAMLVFALLVAPAAGAQALTVRPGLSLALTVLLALLVVWLGVGISYFSVYPAGFFITTISFALYLLARLLSAAAHRYAGPRERRRAIAAAAGRLG
jgi:zinc/manganese transport system permease protein